MRNMSAGFLTKDAAVLLSLLILSGVLMLPYANISFDRDTGSYLLMAKGMLEGKVPFVDLINNKPLGQYVFMIPVHVVSEGDLLRAHIMLAALHALTAFFVFLIGKRIENGRTGFIAALFYLFLAYSPFLLGTVFKAEYAANLFAAAALYFSLRAKEKELWALPGGAAAVLSVTMKQSYIFVPIVVAYALWTHGRGRRNELLLALAGSLLVAVPMTYYLYEHHALGPMIYFTITGTDDPANMSMTIPMGMLDVDKKISLAAQVIKNFPVGLLIILSLYALERLKKTEWAPVLLWLFSSFAVYMLFSAYPYTYYHAMFAPALALSAAAGAPIFYSQISKLNQRIGREKISLYERAKIGIILYFLCAAFVVYIYISKEVVDYGVPFKTSLSQAEILQTSNFLKAHTKKGDYIFVAFTEPEIYYYADRETPIRFVFIGDAWQRGEYPAFQKEVLGALEAKKPEFAVWYSEQTLQEIKNQTKQAKNIVAISSYIDSNYEEAGAFGKIKIMQRKK